MKYKHIILFALFALIASVTSAQIQFTAGINYESGVPSGAPSSTGSRLRVDLASGRIYQWSASNSTWRTLGQGIDIVAGCAAPAYTPGYAQSVFAVNGCNTPELYYYTGTQWKQVAGGGGGATYYAGTGIDIDANDTISIDTVPRLIFFSNQTYSGGIGALRWNDTDGTLDLGLKNGNVTLQVGQELVQLVKNADNAGLDNGKVVYITGSDGDNKKVLYARANTEATSANTFGVMTESVTGGNKGFCTTFGLVRDINTSNLTEGKAVWLSKDTAGAMTAVRPESPNHGVFIGFCVKKHASTGVIFVNIQNGYELDELHNVYAPSPSNGQVLTYVSANSRWEAATVADQSATNELQTLSVASNTATLSNSGGSVTIAGGGINTVATAGSTITVTGTEVDGSVTNEIQTIDQFSLSGQTLSASLSSDGVAPSTVTLPVVNVTGGTNISVTSSSGNYTINNTGAAALSGVTGYMSQFNSATTIDTTGVFWGNGARMGINQATPRSAIHVRPSASGTPAIVMEPPAGATGNNIFSIGAGQTTSGANNSEFAFYAAGPGSTGVGDGPYFGARGNNFSRIANQRGLLFFNSGSVTSPTGLDGVIDFLCFSSYISFRTTSSGTDRLIIQNNGNITIGIPVATSASARLDVRSAGNQSTTDIANLENSDGVDILRIRSDGKNTYWATNTAAGTTAVQTINRPSGTINIAAGESSKVVNNSLCSASSIVFAVVRTNDTTAYIKSVVPGAGSFTINLGAAATAETSVGFFIIN